MASIVSSGFVYVALGFLAAPNGGMEDCAAKFFEQLRTDVRGEVLVVLVKSKTAQKKFGGCSSLSCTRRVLAPSNRLARTADLEREFSVGQNERGTDVKCDDAVMLREFRPGRFGNYAALASSPEAALQGYLVREEVESGRSQSLGAINEVVGILGQIVADRASNKAYSLARDKLLDLMKCETVEESKAAIRFEATCTVLETLRLQDIAASGDSFVRALADDFMSIVRRNIERAKERKQSTAAGPGSQSVKKRMPKVRPKGAPPKSRSKARPLSDDEIFEALKPALDVVFDGIKQSVLSRTNPLDKLDADRLFNALVTGLLSLSSDAKDGVKLAMLGASAAGECRRLDIKGQGCNLETVLRILNGSEETEADKTDAKPAASKGKARLAKPKLPPNGPAFAAARMIAYDLFAALSAPKNTPGRRRFARANSGVFSAFCAVMTSSTSTDYRCPAPAAIRSLGKPRNAIGIIYGATSALIDGDTNRFITVAAKLVELVVEPKLKQVNARKKAAEEALKKATAAKKSDASSVSELKKQADAAISEADGLKDRMSGYEKALRLAGTIAQYTLTFASTNNQSAEERHEARKQILESFTEEMTSRTGRGGDWIFSVGGSLKGVSGARMDRDSDAVSYWGPASLSLGFGLDKLGKTTEWGFHGEFGLVELGSYLSWDEGLKVSTPEVQDAFTLSLMLGVSYGYELPVIVGPVVGFSPSVGVEGEGNASPGSWYIGGALGVFVPLFDFN